MKKFLTILSLAISVTSIMGASLSNGDPELELAIRLSKEDAEQKEKEEKEYNLQLKMAIQASEKSNDEYTKKFLEMQEQALADFAKNKVTPPNPDTAEQQTSFKLNFLSKEPSYLKHWKRSNEGRPTNETRPKHDPKTEFHGAYDLIVAREQQRRANSLIKHMMERDEIKAKEKKDGEFNRLLRARKAGYRIDISTFPGKVFDKKTGQEINFK